MGSSPAAWRASIWWAPLLSSAIRSKAILPDRVRFVCNRDGQDAHGRHQNETAGFPGSPDASQHLSKPKTAGAEPVASPVRADGRSCAAGAWVTLPGRAFAVGRLKAVVPA